MKAVHFGAGNIGRGFIGQLLAASDYEVCFVDINEALVSLLQERKSYSIHAVGQRREDIEVNGITAVHIKDASKLEEEIVQAALITTAVGVHHLPKLAPILVQGLRRRMDESSAPLHIVACENAVSASQQLKQHIAALLSEEERESLSAFVSFPDAVVDRIVPEQAADDSLDVIVETFYEWVMDQSQWFAGVPRVHGVHYVPDLQPFIERKLYTLNTGHCCAAYLGQIHGYDTIQEAMNDSRIRQEVQNVLIETGLWLMSKHDFDPQAHHAYMEQIMERFRNPYLADSITRVGRQPLRKLSSDERLIRPALELLRIGRVPQFLAKSIAAALHFENPLDDEAVKLKEILATEPLSQAIESITGLQANHDLHQLIREHYDSIAK